MPVDNELTPELALQNFINIADATPLTKEQRVVIDKSELILRSVITPKAPKAPEEPTA